MSEIVEIIARYQVAELRRVADYEIEVVATKNGKVSDPTRVVYVVEPGRQYAIGDLIEVWIAKVVDAEHEAETGVTDVTDTEDAGS